MAPRSANEILCSHEGLLRGTSFIFMTSAHEGGRWVMEKQTKVTEVA